MTHQQMTHHLSNQWREFRLENLFLLCQFFCSFFVIRSGTHGPDRSARDQDKTCFENLWEIRTDRPLDPWLRFNYFYSEKMAPEIESQSDPILEYHYRGHKAPVLCSAFNPNQKQDRLR